jgi:hypothetical protein
MAKREGKIDRKRKQRQRCHLPDIGAEPLHFATSRIPGSIALADDERDESFLATLRRPITPVISIEQCVSNATSAELGACAVDTTQRSLMLYYNIGRLGILRLFDVGCVSA